MKSDTDLDLVFKNAIGKKVTLNIEEPKPGVTKAEIDAAMQTVELNTLFSTTVCMAASISALVTPGFGSSMFRVTFLPIAFLNTKSRSVSLFIM